MTTARMAEAEVTLRLAEYLLRLPGAEPEVRVEIDGACVRVHGAVVFDINDFLARQGWIQETRAKGRNVWTGTYKRGDHRLHIGSSPGKGDVVIQIGRHRIIAECKKGPLEYTKGSQELGRIQAALGQAIVWEISEGDIVVVAVPDTEPFRRLASLFRERPLVKRSAIQFCLVNQSGEVTGLDLSANGNLP